MPGHHGISDPGEVVVKAAIENVSEIKEAVVGTFKVQLEGAEEAAHEESVQTAEKESKPAKKTEDKPKAQAAAATQKKPEKKKSQ